MPPPAPAIRIDRNADYKIVLGDSLTQPPSGYSSLKYNYKPSSFVLNPSSPTLVPASGGRNNNSYNLTFTPPTTSTQITYTGAATVPSQKVQHFLLFDPQKKQFTLERLDAAFVFNAEVYAKLHPPIKNETPESGVWEAGGSGEHNLSSDEDDDVPTYDFRNFLGRTTAAEEKRQKRLGALKRAGKEVVDIPEPEEGADNDGEMVIPDAPSVNTGSYDYDDSDVDAPGESDDDEVAPAPPPPPPPPPPPAPTTTKKKPGPKPKAPQKPKAPRAPPKKKAPPPPPPVVEEIVLPDPEPVPRMPLDSDDEEVEFSDEDEEVAPPTIVQAPTPEAPADDDDGSEIGFDIGKELEEALGSGDDGTKAAPTSSGGVHGLGLVFEDEESDEDEDMPSAAVAIAASASAGGGPPKSFRELYGGGADDDEEDEEDSESEEE